MLNIELIITNQCNLRCKYCYMDNVPKFMDLETVEKFIETVGFFLKEYKQEGYSISYFGGEPLLNWELIKKSVPLFKNDSRCKQIVLITNGLALTDSKVAFIKENNLGVSISFDGIWNDENRPLASNDQPSLPVYLKNKDLIKSLVNGCKVMVAPDNIGTMTNNYRFFVEEYGILNPDFSLVRDNVWLDYHVYLFEEELRNLADQYIQYIQDGIQTTVGFFHLFTLDMFIGNTKGKRPFSCFAGCNGVSFNPEGIYYPCARFDQDGKFPLFDTNQDVVYQENINILRKREFTNPRYFKECKECDLYQSCNAGCTYSQLKNGHWERAKPIKNLCEIFKICFRECVRVGTILKDNKLYQDSLKNTLNNI